MNLAGAELMSASLMSANLTGADVTGADLTKADLGLANLRMARLGGATLTGVRLAGADLIGARNLSQHQLDGSVGDTDTKLAKGRTIRVPVSLPPPFEVEREGATRDPFGLRSEGSGRHKQAPTQETQLAAYKQRLNDLRVRFEREHNRLGEARSLLALGDLESTSRQHERARAAYTKAHALYKEAEKRSGEAEALLRLGLQELTLDRHEQARARYTEARALFEHVEDRLAAAQVVRMFGSPERRSARHAEARAAYTEARALFKQLGNRRLEADALRLNGSLERQAGRHKQARTAYTEAAYFTGELERPTPETSPSQNHRTVFPSTTPAQPPPVRHDLRPDAVIVRKRSEAEQERTRRQQNRRAPSRDE